MERDQKKFNKDVLRSRKNESRRLLKGCFGNDLFSLVPFEIWRDIVCFADMHSILLIAQTCYAFKELVDNIGENNFNLALLCRKEGQIDLAKEYLFACANNNNSIAAFHIGYSYFNGGGWGLMGDYEKSAEWFKKSAELGNGPDMAYYCASLYGGYGVEKNKELSDEWAKKALSSNNSFAVGFCYYYGCGVQIDHDKAFRCFEKSANEGDEFGQYMLAVCFNMGKGVEGDCEEALNWYLKSAEQGNASSQYHVGCLLEYGLGCERDMQNAIFWFKKAAKQGLSVGKDELKRSGVD